MKKFATLALAISVVALSALSAVAQPDVHDAGVFSDMGGTSSTALANDFVPFNFYVVGFGLDGLVKGYEFSLTAPPTFTILTAALSGPAPLNVGNNTNVIVGAGGCVDAGQGAFVLTSYNGGFFAPGSATGVADIAFCLGGATPSSFAGGVPGYLQCDNTLVPFGVAQSGVPNHPDGCLILNATDGGPVATESNSFGEVKARF